MTRSPHHTCIIRVSTPRTAYRWGGSPAHALPHANATRSAPVACCSSKARLPPPARIRTRVSARELQKDSCFRTTCHAHSRTVLPRHHNYDTEQLAILCSDGRARTRSSRSSRSRVIPDGSCGSPRGRTARRGTGPSRSSGLVQRKNITARLSYIARGKRVHRPATLTGTARVIGAALALRTPPSQGHLPLETSNRDGRRVHGSPFCSSLGKS